MSAYHAYLDSLDRDAVVSLSTFNKQGIKRLRTDQSPGDAKITAEEYVCVADTPLLDAIGNAVFEIDRDAKNYDRIALVIQTDGQENCSREFTQAGIRQLLTDKQEGEGWLVIFLGADQNAWANAAPLGAERRNTMAYASGNVANAMLSASRATNAYQFAATRELGRAVASFTDEERNAAAGPLTNFGTKTTS